MRVQQTPPEGRRQWRGSGYLTRSACNVLVLGLVLRIADQRVKQLLLLIGEGAHCFADIHLLFGHLRGLRRGIVSSYDTLDEIPQMPEKE